MQIAFEIKCPPFGFIGDGEVGHRIGVRLVGAAQLDVARHLGGNGGDGDGGGELLLSGEGDGGGLKEEGWKGQTIEVDRVSN